MTKSVTTRSDTPNGQQCGLHDNGDNGVRNEFNNNQHDFIAVQETFEMTCSVSPHLNARLHTLNLALPCAPCLLDPHPTH